MIPGFESHFALGTAPLIFEHEGVRYGVAICKDMDFPALGREYAGVAIMLVPAWDFVDDAWLHSRMSILRGVESGYAIARSARNGVLHRISDGIRTRQLHEAPSGPHRPPTTSPFLEPAPVQRSTHKSATPSAGPCSHSPRCS
jgi:apolipoprotein N-acyltransferase